MAFFVGFGVESEYVFCKFFGVGVESECVFVNLLVLEWSRLVSNFKIETKNDANVKCDFDVTIGFPNFEKFGVGV